jgi:SAM-dependent methyltransferase
MATDHDLARCIDSSYGSTMLEELLVDLRTPSLHARGLHVVSTAAHVSDGFGLVEATLVGPAGEDPTQVSDGVWRAFGLARAQRSAAQITNALPMSPWFYESVWRKGAMSRFSGRSFPLSEELAEMFEAVGDVERALVVDIGCSEGLYARNLARRGARVLALDHSRAYCRKARRRAARFGVRIAVAQAVAQNIPVADGSADAIVMGGTLNEIGDRPAAIAEAARVLRPGGSGYIVSLLRASSAPGRILQRGLDLTGIEFPTLDETTALLGDAGLTITDQRVEGVAVRTFVRR